MIVQMGCNFCKICHSYVYKPEDINGYINEAQSEDDYCKFQSITELSNVEEKKIELEGFTDFQKVQNVTEMNNVTNASPYPTITSEEPECVQHELYKSMQKNSSLTESAILDGLNNGLTNKHSDIPVELSGDEEFDQKSGADLPCHGINGLFSVEQGGSSNRSSKGMYSYDEFDLAEAESLEALDFAISYWEFEDCEVEH